MHYSQSTLISFFKFSKHIFKKYIYALFKLQLVTKCRVFYNHPMEPLDCIVNNVLQYMQKYAVFYRAATPGIS